MTCIRPVPQPVTSGKVVYLTPAPVLLGWESFGPGQGGGGGR